MVICTAYQKHNSSVSTNLFKIFFAQISHIEMHVSLCNVSNFEHNENTLLHFSNIPNIIKIISISIFMEI
jgi:hypothetical protein